MAMDLNTQTGGAQVVKLGLAERWILGGVGLVLISAMGYVGTKIDKVDAIDTRTQVMQRDITSIQKTVDALPTTVSAHTIQLADHELRIGQGEKDRAQLRADITELQKTRGLR
ncbi:MAG: hypothetical protein ACREO4_16410 [Lysobacter sp.]